MEVEGRVVDCTPTALRALRLCLKQSPAVASEWAEPPEAGCWAPEWLSEEAPRWIDHIAFRTFAVALTVCYPSLRILCERISLIALSATSSNSNQCAWCMEQQCNSATSLAKPAPVLPGSLLRSVVLVGRTVSLDCPENAAPAGGRGTYFNSASATDASGLIQDMCLSDGDVQVEGMGMQDLAQLFLRLGYRKTEDKLAFPGKKLEAIWLSPPQAHLPRIFISQLKVEELSARSRGILDRLLEHAGPDITERLGLFLPSHPHRFLPWQACTSSDYAALLEESEYAAWTITNGFLANHIAVRVHGLLLDQQHGPGIEQLASTLQNEGYDLNASGGLIKRSEDGLLLQFATKADRVPFRGSSHPEPSKTEDMAGCYVEFAERLVLPEFADLPLSDVQEHHRRDGFEAANADKIFESTFVHAPS